LQDKPNPNPTTDQKETEMNTTTQQTAEQVIKNLRRAVNKSKRETRRALKVAAALQAFRAEKEAK
jgi:hypothetical protein